MSSGVFHRNPALHPFFLLMSVALHVAIFVGWLWYSKWKPATPPPPIMEIIEVTMFEMTPTNTEVVQESTPIEEPPKPEPVAEPEPVVEPPKPNPSVEPEPVVEPPPPPKVEEPPKVAQKEEPPPPPKPKTREERLRERLKNAPISNNPPPTSKPQPQQPQQRKTDDAARRIQERLNQTASSLKTRVNAAPSRNVIGVSAAQMSRYQAYMANSVTPKIASLWNQFGPSGLDTIPRVAVITFVVEPTGRVTSYVISTKSDSAVVNQGAEALGKALMSQGLPPFSAANLVTDRNSPLTIQFTLDYQP